MNYGFSFNPDQSQQLVSLTWGGLVGQTYAPLVTDGWIWGVQKISGWWSPSPNSTREVDAPSGDGKLALDPRLGVRPVTIEGFVRVEDRRATGILEQALDSLAAVRSDVLVVRELKRAVAREVDCRLMDMQVTKVSDRLAKVTLSLQADDPLRWSSGVSGVSLRRNFYGNPSFEVAASSSAVLRRNLASNPRVRHTTGARGLSRPLALDVGSFNLKFKSQAVTNPANEWVNRRAIAADYVRNSGVGLFGVQENSGQGAGSSQVKELAESVGPSWVGVDASGWGWTGFLVDTSRYQLVSDATVVALPADPEDMARRLVYATFEDVGSRMRFVFATCHLADPSWSAAYRQEAAILVAQTMRRVHDRTRLPVVLTGDVNSETSQVGFPRAYFAGMGFQDGLGAPEKINPGVKSHNGWNPMGGQTTLDYVGVLGAEWVSAGVWVEYADGVGFPALLPSDHFPLVAHGQVVQAPVPTRFGSGGAMTIGGSADVFQDWSWPGPQSVGESLASVCIRPSNSRNSAVYVGGSGGAAGMSRLGLVPGKTYGFGAVIRLAAPHTGDRAEIAARRLRLSVETPAGSVDVDSTQAPNEAGEHVVVGSVTIPSDATGASLRVLNGASTPGDAVWASRFVIMEAPTTTRALVLAGEYFSGDSTAVGDFAFAWEGDTDDSTSVMTAPRLVAGVDRIIDGHEGAQPYRSSEWAASGTHSLCIDPAAATGTWTRANPAGYSDVNARLKLIPGRTYTASAILHLEAAQTGSLANFARRIAVQLLQDGVWGDQIVSAQAPNAAGDHQVNLTFTYPSNATDLRLFLYNGSQETRVWWDDLMIVEGIDPTYGDGDSDGWVWDGAPGASSSSQWGITYGEGRGLRIWSGYRYLPNRGDATAQPVVTLIGPMTSPRFDSDAGGAFRMNRDLTAGEIITVDLRNGDVWKDGARIFGATLFPPPVVPPGGARWWFSNPGDGQIWINRFEAWT